MNAQQSSINQYKHQAHTYHGYLWIDLIVLLQWFGYCGYCNTTYPIWAWPKNKMSCHLYECALQTRRIQANRAMPIGDSGVTHRVTALDVCGATRRTVTLPESRVAESLGVLPRL